MKRLISIVTILFMIFMLTFSAGVYAAPLDTINITTTKAKVHPGENVTVEVEFGKELGAYTVDVAYDNNLYEYVSVEGGNPDDNGTRVRTVFHDTSGGTSPRSNMSVTFKAKDVLTSNPTDFSITANGLSNPDASVTYDDITTPIVKNTVVEPKYEDYNIKLEYKGDVIKNEKKDMKLTISSAMGKNYDHTRIITEVTTPKNATIQLLGTDNAGLEHDLIQSGWGTADGDPIGGKNAAKELALKGIFSDSGKYSVTFKLIDRENSDAVIESKTVDITVKDTATTSKPTDTDKEETKPSTKPNNKKPTTMPKTGNTIYGYLVPTIIILGAAYVALKKKD